MMVHGSKNVRQLAEPFVLLLRIIQGDVRLMFSIAETPIFATTYKTD